MSLLRVYFGKTVQTIEFMVNKTKSLSRKSRLKGLIEVEEKMIRGYYMQIGQIYLHNHSDDPEECFLPFIRGIQESTQKIEEFSKQLHS